MKPNDSRPRWSTATANHLLSQGHTVVRLRIIPPGEGSPLYSDLWDETTHELIEAEGSVTRDQLRLLDQGAILREPVPVAMHRCHDGRGVGPPS